MGDVAISVTDAARNLSDCVSRVYHQNQSFVLLKNGVPFARLVSVQPPFCRGSDLAEALSKVEISALEARSWNRELVAARKRLKPARDKWK